VAVAGVVFVSTTGSVDFLQENVIAKKITSKG
jgi:hypothetical protein